MDESAAQEAPQTPPPLPFHIEVMKPAHEDQVISIIRKNLDPFEEAGSLLAASYRRLRNFYQSYNEPGCRYLVVIHSVSREPIGGAGVGPLAGLPTGEGLGEIRELVIDKAYRHQGLGATLLEHAIAFSESIGYRRIYLATTETMEPAQRLFQRFGFKAVEDAGVDKSTINTTSSKLPYYFTLDVPLARLRGKLAKISPRSPIEEG